ncbi:hypothetical protein WJX74_010523 [Apatococcus lobatus]|uniref:Nudix hydrolase domain-containing protein n=1 Tax=Apatococcus lobatus TaxID=904363 RepID=A0AAW1QDK7_9CHLO
MTASRLVSRATWQGSLDGFLDRIRENNSAADSSGLSSVTVEGKCIGLVKPEFCEKLKAYPEVFQAVGNGQSFQVNAALHSSAARTEAVAGVMEDLRQKGAIEGWRNELYPVTESFNREPLLLVERAAATYLGIKAYGVHINGWSQTQQGIELWVARRSPTKQKWPGKLDHLAAGGQPHGLSCKDNVVKECAEEASIPAELAKKAIPTGVVSYTADQPEGCKRDVLFCYDLELPQDFQPEPKDGEVESFQRMPLQQVAELVSNTQEFKINCNLVIIDFLVRHGFLTPEHHGYLSLVSGLRQGNCS